MWFIGVEVEQETSAPSTKKKILDPPLLLVQLPDIFRFLFIQKSYLLFLRRIQTTIRLYRWCDFSRMVKH